MNLEGYVDYLADILKRGKTTYNLPAAFVTQVYHSAEEEAKADRSWTETPEEDIAMESAGYAMSFWFWKDLADRHGEAIVREFLQRARNTTEAHEVVGERSSQNALRILSAITGEKDLGTRISRLDVAKAKRALEQQVHARK